jgi:hypothetical protein
MFPLLLSPLGKPAPMRGLLAAQGECSPILRAGKFLQAGRT